MKTKKISIERLVGILAISMAIACNATSPLDGLSRDEKIVALTILAEARGEGVAGMNAVACVIQQRAKERRLTPAGVCLQKSQFSCWNGKKITDLEVSATKTRESVIACAKGLAQKIVAGEVLDRSRVGFANHYCTTTINPDWSVGKKPVAIIGNHKFYRL